MNDTQRIKHMSVEELREQVATLVRSQQENQGVASSIDRVIPYFKFLAIGAFLIGGWVSTLEFRQHASSIQTDDHAQKIHSMELWKTETAANRFTSKDASEMMNTLMTAVATQDKRLQRVEDSSIFIKETLHKMEQKMQ
jgi:hypothetical protein